MLQFSALATTSWELTPLSGDHLVWIKSFFPSPRLIALPRLKEPSLSSYLTIARDRRGEKKWIHAFLKGISTKGNVISLVQNLS